MMNAREIADLIQISIEDDVDDITAADGGDERAQIHLEKGGVTYQILVIQQNAPEPVEDDDEEYYNNDSEDEEVQELTF